MMRDYVVEKIIFVILFLVVAWSMIERGAPQAVFLFAAFLLLAYGTGMIIWSPRPACEWRGWLAIGTGATIVPYLQSTTVAPYAGVALMGQLVARLLATWLFPREVGDDTDEDNTGTR